MACIQKRKTRDGKVTYRVQVRLNGCEFQTASFDKLTSAKLWAASTESAMKEGRFFQFAEAKKHTIKELCERYIDQVLPRSAPKYRYHQAQQLRRWIQEIGDKTLADTTPAVIVEVRDKLLEEKTARGTKRGPASVHRYMEALSVVFSTAVREWNWCEVNPLSKVKKPKQPRGRVRFLSADERSALLNQCRLSDNPHLETIVVLALSTGMRRGEILGLKWSDIDLKQGVIILHHTKNGERRRVAVASRALDLLRAHAKVRRIDTDLLFPGKSFDKPFDPSRAFETAIRRAEIKDFKFHDLRHSAASELAMGGASLAEIAEILGHKSFSMVKRYSHLSESHTASVVAHMNNRIFGQS